MRYWFDIVNEELSKMSGVNLMVWDSAVDKIIKHRRYKVGNQYKDFVAFYGLFDTVLGVVILCKDDKSIVDFNTRPISQMYNDPFFEFNPEKSSQGIPDMYNRRDNKGTNFYFGNDKKKFDIDEIGRASCRERVYHPV